MQLDRTYKPRRRRRGLARFWPLIVLAIVGIVLYEQRPTWMFSPSLAPTPVPTRSAVSYLADADIALKAGDYAGAMAAYDQVLRLEPDNAQAMAQLSSIHLAHRDLEKATEYAQRAADAGPKDPDALNALARAHDWNGEYEAALNNALDALEIDPNNATSLAILGEIYTDVGNWEVAEDYLQQAAELEPDNVMMLRNLAYLREMRGDYESAIELYDQALEVEPYRFDLHIEKGRQYRVGLLDYEKANQEYQAAVDAYRSAVTLDALGDGLYNAGDHLQAVRVLREATELDPTYGPAFVHLGMALYARRNYEDAATELEKGLRLVGDNARIEQIYTLGLAHIYKEPSECDRAEEWLRKALEIDPESGPALEGLGICGL
jgi:tetratricopeptide (TPR) repeat protein